MRPLPPRPRARVLDIGVGSGEFLCQLAADGWEPWGIEPNCDAADAARRRLQLPSSRIFAGRAEEADFDAGSFDLITARHVVEHLHDPVSVLGKARTWLRDGGCLLMTMPNVASLESRLFGRFWFGLDLPRHLHHFSPRTIRALLDATGFAAERVAAEYDAASWGDSFAAVVRSQLAPDRPFRRSPLFYYLLLPVGSIAHGLGSGASMVVTARRRGGGSASRGSGGLARSRSAR